MFKQILVPVDGSEHSFRSLAYAKTLARLFDATLWLVHAFPQTTDLLGYDEYEKLVGQRETAGQAILAEARQQLNDEPLDIHEELLEEPAAEAILSVAETREVDLIIMGTRGLGTLQGLLLGSVSHKVMQHASCPVMLIR
jgi:nucleotide-binding universal stress UspA family protein